MTRHSPRVAVIRPRHRNGRVLVEPPKVWLQSTVVWALLSSAVGGTILGTAFYFRVGAIEQTTTRIQKDIELDRAQREKDREAFVGAVREVRDEIRKVVSDSVAIRQATTWIENARLLLVPVNTALEKQGIPPIVLPDLPR